MTTTTMVMIRMVTMVTMVTTTTMVMIRMIHRRTDKATETIDLPLSLNL